MSAEIICIFYKIEQFLFGCLMKGGIIVSDGTDVVYFMIL